MCGSCQLTIKRSVFSWSQICHACVDTFTTAFLVYRWRNMPLPQRQCKLGVSVQSEGHPLRAVNALRSHWRKKKWRAPLKNLIGSEHPEADGGPNERNKSASPQFDASVLCPDCGTSRFTHFGSSFTILVSSPLNPRHGYLQVGADSPRREQLEPGEPVLRLVRCWSERDRGERGEERRPGSKRWGGPQ